MLTLRPNEIDLAQTIAAIVNQHDSPNDKHLNDVYDPKRHEGLGVLPKHLCHLYDFLLKIKGYTDEVAGEVEKYSMCSYAEQIENVFNMSLSMYIKFNTIEDKDVTLRICKGWLVVKDK